MTVEKVIDLVSGPPPGETTHWTGRMLAKALEISLRSVQRILEAYQLTRYRIRPATFKVLPCNQSAVLRRRCKWASSMKH